MLLPFLAVNLAAQLRLDLDRGCSKGRRTGEAKEGGEGSGHAGTLLPEREALVEAAKAKGRAKKEEEEEAHRHKRVVAAARAEAEKAARMAAKRELLASSMRPEVESGGGDAAGRAREGLRPAEVHMMAKAAAARHAAASLEAAEAAEKAATRALEAASKAAEAAVQTRKAAAGRAEQAAAEAAQAAEAFEAAKGHLADTAASAYSAQAAGGATEEEEAEAEAEARRRLREALHAAERCMGQGPGLHAAERCMGQGGSEGEAGADVPPELDIPMEVACIHLTDMHASDDTCMHLMEVACIHLACMHLMTHACIHRWSSDIPMEVANRTGGI